MTLMQIITSALEERGHTTDSQQQKEWRIKFTQFANDGMTDLAKHLQLRRTDVLRVVDGEIDVRNLPYECTKVLRITQNGAEVGFSRGSSTFAMKIASIGDVSVEYRYIPKELSSDTDEPGIPKSLHGLLVTYVCAREYQTSDENTQRRANPYYGTYEAGKKQARQSFGEPESYTFINTVW